MQQNYKATSVSSDNRTMTEKWIKWEPIEGLAKKYFVDSVIDTDESFAIQLSAGDNRVQVVFENWIGSYRRTDETLRYKLILDLNAKYGGSFYGDWTFFKVENSLYLQWLSEQSHTLSDHRGCMHFSFIADDSILDVVTTYEPKVTLL